VPVAVRAGDLPPGEVARRLRDAGIAPGADIAEDPGHGGAGAPDAVGVAADWPARPSDIHIPWVEHPRPGVPRGAAGGTPASPDRPAPRGVLHELAARVGPARAAALLCAPLDAVAAARTRARHERLAKPPGSLGRLEALGSQLAGIAGSELPPVPHPAVVVVFAGDHGVHARGVSPWPQEITAGMVTNFLAGGAAVNVLARQAGAEVVVVDVGVATPLDPAPGLVDRKVRRGTADLSAGPAMTPDEAQRALDAGAEIAIDRVAAGARCLVTGDMGIANTTPSAALVAALTGRPAGAVTGRGTGIDDATLAHKTALVAGAVDRARATHGDDVLGRLAEVGGLEHAALAGYVLAGVALQVPVVIDGIIAASALLVASRLAPGVERAVIPGHRSLEPGSAAALDALGLTPLLDLQLHLGEGTGAVLALPLVEAAARVLREMASLEDAGLLEATPRSPGEARGSTTLGPS
ncbi:MAG: nicotinate-nucleotide--dimethylbenzimidazole phosphoribosyltransferase, partial [Acidimicrobiia bacterium]